MTFDSNGGSTLEPVEIENGKTLTEQEAPTKDGYRFDGWYTDSELTQSFDFSTPITADMTLYAKWAKEAVVDPDPVDPAPVVPDDQPSTWENPFTDVGETDWYYGSVRFAAENGLFRGISYPTFAPHSNMTHGMLAMVLHRLAKEPEIGAGQSFSNVAQGQYYTEAVAWATEKGIVSGYGDGKFGPGDLITREHLTVMLWRYAGKPAGAGELDGFTDAADADAWAVDALRWAVEQKIVNGRSDGTLDPRGNATRAEVVAILMRYCETVK